MNPQTQYEPCTLALHPQDAPTLTFAWPDSEEQVARYLRESFEGWVLTSYLRCRCVLASATVLLEDGLPAQRYTCHGHDCPLPLSEADRLEVGALRARLTLVLLDLEPIARALAWTDQPDLSTPWTRLHLTFMFFRFLTEIEGATELWEQLARANRRVINLWAHQP